MKQELYRYIKEFQDNNEYGIYFLDNIDLDKSKVKVTQWDMEHILDFVWSNKKKYSRLNYSTVLEKANSWTKKLQERARKTNIEEVWDTELIKELWEWFKIVKLVSRESYEREWKLMSHCVGSFYWRWHTIYSLRDEYNFPHCTIEEWNQLKGKWNKEVWEKYIHIVLDFLESTGMKVSDRDMCNLGYVLKPKWLKIEWTDTFKEKFIKRNIFI
jgi:hypothetical protein